MLFIVVEVVHWTHWTAKVENAPIDGIGLVGGGYNPSIFLSSRPMTMESFQQYLQEKMAREKGKIIPHIEFVRDVQREPMTWQKE